MGPCMCGDTHCPSCGQTQGNYQCPICKAWADDCCEHFDEDGELKAEFEAQAEQIAKDEAHWWETYAEDVAKERKLTREEVQQGLADRGYDTEDWEDR